MKRFISILFTACMCISIGMALTACGDNESHEHIYKAEWAYDDTHHWHACEGEDCTEASDKAEHTWNDGEITTEATAEADGVKTFTCTVCGQTKAETVEYTVKSTVTAEEWVTALNLYEYNNLEYIQTAEPLSDFFPNCIVRKENHNKVYIEYNSPDSTVKEYYVEENGNYFCYYLENDSWHKTEISETDLEYSYMETIMLAPLFNFQDFEFDSISGYYKAEQTGNSEYGLIINNAVIKMADCKVVEIQFETNNIAVSITVNYDKTELNIPTVSESTVNTVTKEEWETALACDYSVYQSKYSVYKNSTLQYSIEVDLDNDKIREITIVGEKMAIDYLKRVEGGWYFYNDETESNDINAVRTYSKYFETSEEGYSFEEAKGGVIAGFLPFLDCYDAFTYDNERKFYTASSIEDYRNIVISMSDGKLYYLTYTVDDYTYEFEMGYEENAFSLPEVTQS